MCGEFKKLNPGNFTFSSIICNIFSFIHGNKKMIADLKKYDTIRVSE